MPCATCSDPSRCDRAGLCQALASEQLDSRPCTCRPDDNPPTPCPRKFALSECRAAADDEAYQQHQRDRIAEAQRHDAEQAKPKLTFGVAGTVETEQEKP